MNYSVIMDYNSGIIILKRFLIPEWIDLESELFRKPGLYQWHDNIKMLLNSRIDFFRK
jgi:hypothetical protein